jgi:hypothetical protein
MVKQCLKCSPPQLIPSQEWIRHQRQHRDQARPTTSDRGYGAQHQRARREYQRRMDRGELFVCPRCHGPILLGDEWDLGHYDTPREPRVISGPEHSTCNRAAAGRLSANRSQL